VEITRVELLNADGADEVLFSTGEPLTVKIEYVVHRPPEEPPVVGLAFIRNDTTWCYGTNTEIEQVDTGAICLPQYRRGQLRFVVDSLPLLPGTYTLDVAIQSRRGGDHDYWRFCAGLTVRSLIRDTGVARIDHRWIIEPTTVADPQRASET
jgi:ABC-2 type transport system ATP-binding protein